MLKGIIPPKKKLEKYLLKSGKAYLQLVKPRYFRKVDNANTIGIKKLINSMPVISQKEINSSDIKFVVIKKDYPWTQQDVSIFALSPTEPKMLFDLTLEEGCAFFKLNKKILDTALETPGCLEAYCAIGFNPKDDAIGCHTVKRLHSHVCVLDQEYLSSRIPFNKNNASNWYFLLTFYEPFTQIFFDIIQNYCQSKKAKNTGVNFKLKNIIHHKYNKISLRLDKNDFSNAKMFLFISQMLEELALKYSKLEAIFTNYKIDPLTNRYLPKPKEIRLKELNNYFEKSNYSNFSYELIKYLAVNLKKASKRERGRINKRSQMWISKGFSGACIFRFKKKENSFTFEFYPKVLATQALTRGNGLNSGASTIKVPSTLEDNTHLINKMESFTNKVQKNLERTLIY